ncbi:piggyBac transposable element-derived protein 3-like [Melitaea cinxia]|uniref:piggyBac transposable element-derived protein 3-like n=1 Tax=Melitaea cinxia TaxID=113334 RepID=UPI001E27471E|nr:piggyBac transposable element-derived protein 3-like [Melitaea cinxia]
MDEDLSDDELRRNRGHHLPPLLIPESDESDSDPDDNILLSQLASSSTRASRAERPRWRDGFLERAESELQCYWNENLGHPKISTVMSCNRFEEIKRFIHFNDNALQIPKGQTGHNPLHKIQPFLDHLRQRFLTIPKEEYMAVDEQIIPTKSRSSMRQYNPKKPHKWGYKNFVLSGSSGFSYDFEIYTGAQGCVESDSNLPKISTSSDVVVRLSRTIPEGANYKLFFDNWYTSLPLLIYLNKKAILPLGTIKANRIPGYKVPAEKDLKKLGRGATIEKLTTVDNTDISIVSWYDNRVVNLASTYVGSTPASEVRRFNQKEKAYQNLPCPKAVMTYNRHMGSVDLLDALLGYYRIQIRSKKFYHRIFFHMIDMVTVNAWLLYRRGLDETEPYLP